MKIEDNIDVGELDNIESVIESTNTIYRRNPIVLDSDGIVIGKSYLTPGMGSHRREFEHMLVYVSKGEQDFYIANEDRWENGKEGSFIIYEPNSDTTRKYNGKHMAENYHIIVKLSDAFFEEFGFKTGKLYHAVPSWEVTSYLNMILQEQEAALPMASQAKLGMLSVVFALLYRNLTVKQSDAQSDDDIIIKLIYYIKRDYSKKYTLDDFAKLTGLSKYYISHLFKKQVGVSLIGYRNQVRLG